MFEGSYAVAFDGPTAVRGLEVLKVEWVEVLAQAREFAWVDGRKTML